jgi:hypothetical protein
MNPTEAALLCAYAEQCCPQQKFNEYTGDAWGDLLADIRYIDAKEAIVAITRRSPWVSPAEIIGEVKKIRRKRIDEYGPITPPADLDPDDTAAYREWWAGVQKAIADGEMRPKELDLPKRDVKALTRGAFRRVPAGRYTEQETAK